MIESIFIVNSLQKSYVYRLKNEYSELGVQDQGKENLIRTLKYPSVLLSDVLKLEKA